MAFRCMKKNKPPVTLVDRNKKYPLPLIEREDLTHNTRRLRFGLPSPKHVLGISIGEHFSFTAMIDGEPVVRIYTSISTNDEVGYVDVVVKIYFKTEKFPNGGKMSLYLESLKIGDTIDFRGPVGKHKYLGNGKILLKTTKTKVKAKKFNMIAGGTGITPMFQMIKHICQDPKDSTLIKLLFANSSEDDLILKKELDEFASKYPSQVQIWYTVGRSITQDWTYSVGRINEEMIRSRLFPAATDVLVLMCGPDPLIDLTCKPALENIGFKPNQLIAF